MTSFRLWWPSTVSFFRATGGGPLGALGACTAALAGHGAREPGDQASERLVAPLCGGGEASGYPPLAVFAWTLRIESPRSSMR